MTSRNQKKQIKVLLVDDHPLVRKSLSECISRESDLTVCAEAEDREGALAAIENFRPNLAIVDLILKNSDGMMLIKDIHDLHPKTLILVLSAQDESLYAERVIRAGASGFISKQEAPVMILDAVRKVLDREIYLSPQAAAHVASRMLRPGHDSDAPPMDLLSERELQVFELIGLGVSTTEITDRLHIGARTVETYRTRIKQKLNLADASKLLQAAIQWTVSKGTFSSLASDKARPK